MGIQACWAAGLHTESSFCPGALRQPSLGTSFLTLCLMKQKKVFQSISNEIKGSGIWSLGWTPLQGLGLISPGEFWPTGPCSGPPCSANARHTLFIPWLHTYTLCQCSWTKSHLQQGWQGGAGGKFGLAQTSVFALSRLKACSSFHLGRKEGSAASWWCPDPSQPGHCISKPFPVLDLCVYTWLMQGFPPGCILRPQLTHS